MYGKTDLVNEVSALIDNKLGSGCKIHPDWITQEIMGAHKDIKGNDADFYIFASRLTVRDQVLRRIRSYNPSPETQAYRNSQTVLPGFERLQVAYVIDEDNESIAIPLSKMTSVQRITKVNELRAMGAGCYLHADELERYDELYPNETIAA